jgi:L,D-peptidoglycan transpeptidase YkuD (ErfK/YbiS/YcfS/YnhG family)
MKRLRRISPVKKTTGHKLSWLSVTALPSFGGISRIGRIKADQINIPCAIGTGGFKAAKREGDGATPLGTYRLLHGYFRKDRLPRPLLALPLRATRPDDGWCDDPQSPAYNHPLKLPAKAGHEKMWREDQLYDLVIVLDYNIFPRHKTRGSAIFMHCARLDLAPTAGCIALRPADMRRLLPRLGSKVKLKIN